MEAHTLHDDSKELDRLSKEDLENTCNGVVISVTRSNSVYTSQLVLKEAEGLDISEGNKKPTNGEVLKSGEGESPVRKIDCHSEGDLVAGNTQPAAEEDQSEKLEEYSELTDSSDRNLKKRKQLCDHSEGESEKKKEKSEHKDESKCCSENCTDEDKLTACESEEERKDQQSTDSQHCAETSTPNCTDNTIKVNTLHRSVLDNGSDKSDEFIVVDSTSEDEDDDHVIEISSIDDTRTSSSSYSSSFFSSDNSGDIIEISSSDETPNMNTAAKHFLPLPRMRSKVFDQMTRPFAVFARDSSHKIPSNMHHEEHPESEDNNPGSQSGTRQFKPSRHLKHHLQNYDWEKAKSMSSPNNTDHTHTQSSSDNSNHASTCPEQLQADGQKSDKDKTNPSNMRSPKTNLNRVPRRWEYTDFGKEYLCRNVKKHTEISVMSYNVLSQDLLEGNINLYTGCDPDMLDWEHRRIGLLKEIKDYRPDVVCLQEVNNIHLNEFFSPELKTLGYDGEYNQRTGGKLDGCATFYKSSKFDLDSKVPVNYLCPGSSLMDRDNVGLIIKLKVNIGDEVPAADKNNYLVVANTHLLYNPNRGDIKLGQIMMLLAEIDRVSFRGDQSNYSYYPTILCGDLNSTPYSHLLKFLIRGYLDYEGLYTSKISGQRKKWKAKELFLSKSFFPTTCGITDQCQLECVLPHRPNIQQKKASSTTDPVGLASMCSHSSGSSSDESGKNPSSGGSKVLSFKSVPYCSQSSGHLWHRLNFVSAHKFRIERFGCRESEITTYHHNDGVNVDYILYNVTHKDIKSANGKIWTENVSEESLHLIGRLGLMSFNEMRKIGSMPNSVFPSDHVFLLARFLLT